MKKIISLISVAAMLLATAVPAFAATAEVTNCAPKATVTLNHSEEPDEDGYYFCTLKVDLSDLGDLSGKYASKKLSGTRLTFASFNIRTDEANDFISDSLGGTLGDAGSRGNSKDYKGNGQLGYNYVYTTTDAKVAFPVADSTNKDVTANSLAGAVELSFYILPNSTVTILDGAQVGYLPFEASAITAGYETLYADLTFDKTTFEIPAKEEVKDVVINSGDKYDNGYVWNVTVNKDMEAFGVKFSTANDSIEKSVKNVEDLPKLDGGVGYKFNVGLKTTNELTQADFTADDYTATWIAE